MIALDRPWTLPRHCEVVASLPFGKRLPTAHYFLDDGEGSVPPDLRDVLGKLREKLGIATDFNVIKLSTDCLKISFLSYPDFFSDPHPALHHSISIDLAVGTGRRSDYRGRANPPILHRISQPIQSITSQNLNRHK